MSNFSPCELEVILSGQPEVDISFIKRRTTLVGYSRESSVVKWLWEVLESYSQVHIYTYDILLYIIHVC